MEATLRAVYIALQTAPLIALVLVFPHTVFGYLRAKSLNVRRSTYVYIFVLYFICAYFMTMLPLPSRESFADMRPVRELIQLVPFQNFLDIEAQSWLHDVAILVFNVFLTVPLGFFLRFLFKFSFRKTVLSGFLTALLYEVTQLTGLFFIYPRPYRIFDVDDLIINTLGAVIGYLCVPLARKMLPDPDSSRRQLVQGSEVAFFHRFSASAIDFCMILGITSLIGICIPPLGELLSQSGSLLRFPVIYVLFLSVGAAYSLLLKGGTLGYRLLGLRLLTSGGHKASRLRGALRATLVYATVVAIPFWVYFFMSVNTEYAGATSVIWVFFGALLMMCAAAILLEMMFNAVTHGSSMFYDRAVNTHAAYGNSRKSSLFGIRVIDILPLTAENIDKFSDEISQTLSSKGVSEHSATRVRLMAEGVMLDWIANGLADARCELRLDKRYRRNALMLSVIGEDKTEQAYQNGYTEMLSGLDLTLRTYYAGEKNICNILIPRKE